MENLVTSAQNFFDWIQIPKFVFAAIMLGVAGFCWMLLGQKGTQIAKNIAIGVLIGLVIISGGETLVNSFAGNIDF